MKQPTCPMSYYVSLIERLSRNTCNLAKQVIRTRTVYDAPVLLSPESVNLRGVRLVLTYVTSELATVVPLPIPGRRQDDSYDSGKRCLCQAFSAHFTARGSCSKVPNGFFGRFEAHGAYRTMPRTKSEN